MFGRVNGRVVTQLGNPFAQPQPGQERHRVSAGTWAGVSYPLSESSESDNRLPMNEPKHQPGEVEREFGVAFPGRIVEQSKWTQTALKAMPDGLLDWKELFRREAPVVLDLGCGNGRYLIGSAITRPDHDHLGTDILPVVIRYARKRGNQRGLANLKFAVLGGRELLEKHIPPHSVAEIHCYHPQPYYDPAKVHLRLITPAFVASVHRSLKPGGLFVVQTDNPGYW